MSNEWSDRKKWIMGIMAALIVASVGGLAGILSSNGKVDPSILPHIDIGYKFVSSEGFTSGVTIDNAGLGPAIIKKVSISWKAKEGWVPLENWRGLSDKLGVEHTEVIPLVLKNDNALAPGRNLLLYAVKWDTAPSIELQKNINNVQVIVEYESLAGNAKKSVLH